MNDRNTQKNNNPNSELLIVVPAFNEAGSIVRTIKDLVNRYPEYDYIIIDDGSTDDTNKLCDENDFQHISLPINLGIAGAMQTGFKYANLNHYKYVIQFDGDGQHKAEYIPIMLENIKNNKSDIMIGSRYLHSTNLKNMRMFGSMILAKEIKLVTGRIITDPTSGMRLFGERMINIFASSMNFGPEPDTISYLIKCGAKVDETEVEMQERITGKSYLNLWRSVFYMLHMCISIAFIQFFRRKEDLNE